MPAKKAVKKKAVKKIDTATYKKYLKYEKEIADNLKKEEEKLEKEKQYWKEWEEKEDVQILADKMFENIVKQLKPKGLQVIKIPKEVPPKFEQLFIDTFWGSVHDYAYNIFSNYTIRSSRPKQKRGKKCKKMI